jgi:hypothetical protein
LDKFVEQAVRTAEHSGFEDRAIALVPVTQTDMMNRDGLQASLNKLTQAGIRFIQMNNTQLADARNDVDKNARLSFQLHTYLMMIAVRNLPKGAVDPTSSAYKTLEFYLNSHFGLEKGISVEEYILAIAKDEVAQLLKGILTYRPADAYQLPAYDTIVAVLRAA